MIGGTVFVNGKGFLPENIRIHMTKYGHALELFTKREIDWEAAQYNHTETIIPLTEEIWKDRRFGLVNKYGSPWQYANADGDILMSCGARKSGGEMTPLALYLNDHDRFAIKVPKAEFKPDAEQKHRMMAYALDVCFYNKRPYEKAMFLKWILKVNTGIDLGKHDDTKIYCYELSDEFNELNGYSKLTEKKLIDIFYLWSNPYKELYLTT